MGRGCKTLQVSVGAVLRLVRQRRGMSQEELAEELVVDRSVVSRIESGKQHPPFETVLKWTDVTNAKEVLVAFFCGVDGTSLMQNILSLTGAA